MIKLVFSRGRETFTIDIKNREIWYSDRMQGKIRFIPQDENFKRKVIMSRNKIRPEILDWFNLSKEEKQEYDNAKTEEGLSEIIIKDCQKRGGKLLKKE